MNVVKVLGHLSTMLQTVVTFFLFSPLLKPTLYYIKDNKNIIFVYNKDLTFTPIHIYTCPLHISLLYLYGFFLYDNGWIYCVFSIK